MVHNNSKCESATESLQGFKATDNLTEPSFQSFSATSLVTRSWTSLLHVHDDFAKWVLISIVIGIACGISALILIQAINLISVQLLGAIAGYYPPKAGGEGGTSGFAAASRPYLIPLVTSFGGFIGGLLVYIFAIEAQGIGTDSAIKAFHEENAIIRPRVPLLKLLASAITIGSGGTSGREGPIAQIGAGVGSQISTFLKLDKRTREISLAAGLGAGIASIYKAPLAGAIISAEIFYIHDFEVEALIPGLISSVVGYSIVGYATRWQPVFFANVNPTEFNNPLSLPFYAMLGILCAGLALFLFRVYFPVSSKFMKFKAPLYVKTTIGGLATGLIALIVPSVLGTGYGWVQIALDQNYLLFPPLLILVAIFAEIVSFSFTLGSGGSGGAFGHSVVIGGLLGAFFGFVLNMVFPSIVANPSDFAIVGMMTFFAADAKAPISTIVLIAEMTGGYGLLAPSMLAVAPAVLLSGRKTIFPSQVHKREDSPTHAAEYEALVLQRTPVSSVMKKQVQTISKDASISDAQRLMHENSIGALPVTDEKGSLVGIITRQDILNLSETLRISAFVKDVMVCDVVTVEPDVNLYKALEIMTEMEIGRLPVVPHKNGQHLLGIITRSDVGEAMASKHKTISAD